jgi:hypothetical protein
MMSEDTHTERSTTKKPYKKRQWRPIILSFGTLLIVTGAVGLYLLGREDPQEPGSAQMAWGDRVERRLDALIDGIRPEWTNRVEKRMDNVIDRTGWK